MLRPRVPSIDGDHFAFFQGVFRRPESWFAERRCLGDRSTSLGDRGLLMRRARERAEPQDDDPAAGQRCTRRFLFRLAIVGCLFIGSSFTARTRQSHCFQLGFRRRPRFESAFLKPTLPINFCKHNDIRARPFELSIPAREKTAIFPPPTSALLRSFLRRERRRTSAGQASEDATEDGIPSCEVGCLLLHPHPSHERIAAPLPMALRPRAVRPSEGTSDQGISAESLSLPLLGVSRAPIVTGAFCGRIVENPTQSRTGLGSLSCASPRSVAHS